MTSSILGQIEPNDFLQKYWQKKPLVIRQAFNDFELPVEADELAGLALDEEVESRIIIEKGKIPWELKRGPFTEETFASLPPSHWTLLVQAVDHWVPDVHHILEGFDFLPSWRMDDIMISVASDGGSVGPHFDQYDVFLIQAEGKRHWQIGPVYDASSPKLEGTELHILSEFEVLEEHVMEPGDILYLPPGVGHNGVAVGDNCMTISVGFRAPSHREILMQYTDFIADQLPDSMRYADSDQTIPANKGEIDDKALDRLQAILREHIEDRSKLAQWFGHQMTQLKHEQEVDCQFESWGTLLEALSGTTLAVNEGSRLAFRKDNEQFILFADGCDYPCLESVTQFIAMDLCKNNVLYPEDWENQASAEVQTLILRLINSGSLYIQEMY
ncbi:cupin [Endozoicomonas sp. OPT23]|uniref:cupin domain-containing protein n=1 Tax=Endozoicomonas sp. OPT23 TaxID=2072845 RepID=UPI00129B4B8E|nr:cupin domain-containing protein [Endozoicomonas sp. OPT23]MRI33490.1 cupin [Endozoicomonas sp. OPT23]